MIKTDRYVQTEAAGMLYRLIPVTEEIIRCVIGKEEIKGNDSLIIEKKEYPAVEFAAEEKEEKLDELTLKIDDVEALIDEVSDIAYDKAVEVVADTVRVETHRQDIKMVEQSKAWVLSPEQKASKKEKEYAAARLDGVIIKITKAMQTAMTAIKTTLMKPEVKKTST